MNELLEKILHQVTNYDLFKVNFNLWETTLLNDKYDEVVNKGFIKNNEITKEEFNELHNELNNNFNFNYFIRNWTVLDDEETRHEDDINKDIEYFKIKYNVDDNTANTMKIIIDKFLNI